MKIKNFSFTIIEVAILCLAILTSCAGNELDVKVPANKYVTVEGDKILIVNNTLSFTDQKAFDYTLRKIKLTQNQSNNNPIVYFSSANNKPNKINGFKSLYDYFYDALDEAKNYYTSKENYAKFKSKYENLYFPEYKDDYSVYLPIDDEEIARLLNTHGEVFINGKLTNLKNIDSYSRLQELGFAMYSDPKIQTISKITPLVFPLSNPIQLNKEYIKGDVKYWLTVNDVNHQYYEFNINFRIKGFLGFWYNLRTDSWVTLKIDPTGPSILDPTNELIYHPSIYNEKSPHKYTWTNGSIPIDTNIASGEFRFRIDSASEVFFTFYMK